MTAATKEDKKVEDVEMKEAGEEEKVEKKDPDLLSVEDIREHCKLIRRSTIKMPLAQRHLLFYPPLSLQCCQVGPLYQTLL